MALAGFHCLFIFYMLRGARCTGQVGGVEVCLLSGWRSYGILCTFGVDLILLAGLPYRADDGFGPESCIMSNLGDYGGCCR